MFDCGFFPKGYSLRLVLIRHGEPEREAEGRCYGRFDVGLSDAGRKQIQDKLKLILNLKAVALYASPLKRAMESAAIAGASLGLQPTIAPDLQEINFGCFEGLTYSEIEKLYPEEFRVWMEHPAEIKFPQGESFAEVKARVLRFKELLLETHAGETVVLVSHGGVNRVILAEALGVQDDMIFRINQVYAAVNIIDYFQGSPIVRLVNG